MVRAGACPVSRSTRRAAWVYEMLPAAILARIFALRSLCCVMAVSSGGNPTHPRRWIGPWQVRGMCTRVAGTLVLVAAAAWALRLGEAIVLATIYRNADP